MEIMVLNMSIVICHMPFLTLYFPSATVRQFSIFDSHVYIRCLRNRTQCIYLNTGKGGI